ncbi:AraC family transcriptional regulator [Pedobacter antarcticus]|uniref:helix-turn-helix domain-containing protein n=1 Tax=Pedobacter antarcticus TaxID=34086 RepID=UPI002930AC55|nr:AraC family transcriptional regulator [Pedobacter antarcticus]
MKKSAAIPFYSLEERGRGFIEIRKLDSVHDDISSHPAHRDDNYILIYQESGVIHLMIDFQEVVIEGAAICCVHPGQVHFGISATPGVGWFIAVDPVWIADNYRQTLLGGTMQSNVLQIEAEQALLFRESIQLLGRISDSHSDQVHEQTLRSMLGVCVSLFCAAYQKKLNTASHSGLRTAIISRQFRSLLLTHFRTIKSPSAYAGLMYISPVYLNEAVKGTTGHPVSYWIHEQVILEAKRLLFYTESTVKEIAFNLGYSDPTYLIRLFSKIAGCSPLQFRQKYKG